MWNVILVIRMAILELIWFDLTTWISDHLPCIGNLGISETTRIRHNTLEPEISMIQRFNFGEKRSAIVISSPLNANRLTDPNSGPVFINSLLPSDAIRWQGSESILARVMPLPELMLTYHQSGLWHSLEGIIIDLKIPISKTRLKAPFLESHPPPPHYNPETIVRPS